MLLAIGLCIGFVFGISATLCVLRKGSIGNLMILDDPENGSYMFLEIGKTDIEELRMRSVIKLRVVDKGKVSHK